MKIDINALKQDIKTAKENLKPLAAEAKAACKAEEKQIKLVAKLEAKLPKSNEPKEAKAEIRAEKATLKGLAKEAKNACKAEDRQIKLTEKLKAKLEKAKS